MKYIIKEIETGKVIHEYDAKNVEWSARVEDIKKMRADKDHAKISFMMSFKGLEYGMGMWSVDKYDLEIA